MWGSSPNERSAPSHALAPRRFCVRADAAFCASGSCGDIGRGSLSLVKQASDPARRVFYVLSSSLRAADCAVRGSPPVPCRGHSHIYAGRHPLIRQRGRHHGVVCGQTDEQSGRHMHTQTVSVRRHHASILCGRSGRRYEAVALMSLSRPRENIATLLF